MQTIFADKTYPKPFFVTYINTSLFILPLFTILLSRTWSLWCSRQLSQVDSFRSLLRHLDSDDPTAEEQSVLRAGSVDDEAAEIDSSQYLRSKAQDADGRLGLRATANLSLQFCLLWVWTPRSSRIRA